jgi:polar amino acid transport system permease protein
MRPSNLVLLAALPLILYLFVADRNHQRSLVAILGIEDNALALLWGYVAFLAMPLAGALASLARLRGMGQRAVAIGWMAAGANLALAAGIALGADVSAFVGSVVANSVDPFTSDLILKAVLPRRLTPDAMAWATASVREGALFYLLASAVLHVLAQGFHSSTRWRLVSRWAHGLLLAVNGAGILYLLFVAYPGFAAGLFVTLRAGIFGYIAAALLGLIWVGLQSLKPKLRTIPVHIGATLIAFAGAGICYSQTHDTFVLVGSLEKEVGILAGAPQSLVDDIRYGEFDGGGGREVRIRTLTGVDDALTSLGSGDKISAAFLPEAAAPKDLPVLWRVTFLPDRLRLPAVGLTVIGALIAIFTFGAWLHSRHPMAVAAEFLIDALRGVPLLVVILYVGLPLSGAIKDATGGGIDLNNLTRGVIALSLGYSAYMAEIFRAGIEAVPKGQIEAARSLGLKNWQVIRLVILPQALRVIVPPLGNEFIAILKDTSLLSILSVRDVTQRMREFQSASFLPFAPFNTVAIFYVILTLIVASMLKWVERRHELRIH